MCHSKSARGFKLKREKNLFSFLLEGWRKVSKLISKVEEPEKSLFMFSPPFLQAPCQKKEKVKQVLSEIASY